MLKLCILGPSLWPNIELGAEMVKWKTKRFKKRYALVKVLTKKTFTALRVKMNTYYWELEKERKLTEIH